MQDQVNAASWDVPTILHNDWPYLLLGLLTIGLLVFLAMRREP